MHTCGRRSFRVYSAALLLMGGIRESFFSLSPRKIRDAAAKSGSLSRCMRVKKAVGPRRMSDRRGRGSTNLLFYISLLFSSGRSFFTNPFCRLLQHRSSARGSSSSGPAPFIRVYVSGEYKSGPWALPSFCATALLWRRGYTGISSRTCLRSRVKRAEYVSLYICVYIRVAGRLMCVTRSTSQYIYRKEREREDT